MIRGHGDDTHNYPQEIKINFSSNVYNHTNMSGLENHLCSKIAQIHTYPDPDATTLAHLLAQKYQINPNNITVTNGATEAIYLIAQAYRNHNSHIITPTFSEYGDACTINQHQIHHTPSLHHTKDNTQLVWLCNPNNPDGKAYHKHYLYTHIANHPHTLFIVDQSYEAFTSPDNVMQPSRTVHLPNLITLHSMTKQYTIPGLRLGYITAHAQLIEKINKHRMPWSVNQLAIEAGKYLIQENKNYFHIQTYLAETQRLATTLNTIPGLTTQPTQTHFFLCKLEHKTAAQLKQHLIQKHGILIRDASNFEGLDQHYFRIATQSPDQNNTLIKAIKQWI